MPTLIERLTRKKIVNFGNSELRRALTLLDLTFLGVGSTIGVGFYVLVGNVARSFAGPAVVLSFLIAGIASIFAGLCYAEFGARVPKAGSAYIYSYVCVGECVAFIIGWNLLLEYVIGASSVAKGFSGYIDALANYSMSEGLESVMPINVPFLSDFPDFLTFGLILVVSILLALGIKESSTLNNVFSSLNLVVVIYVIIAASTKVDTHNWHLTINDTETLCHDGDWGIGGFAPYGFPGIMRGAGTCFFGFVGFDCIATTGEEALNPSRNIPLSISLSLLIIFLAYFGMSATVTLALPYCLQDPNAALVSFFELKHMETSKWIVSIGALFGFSASLVGVLLPLPRIVYAMANDGLIFRFLATVNKRFRTPFLATLVTGIIAGVIGMIFDLTTLVDMMSIGTLMAYSIVALSVMLLRYVPGAVNEDSDSLVEYPQRKESQPPAPSSYSTKDILRQMFNLDRIQDPTELSGRLVAYATLVFCVLVAVLCILMVTLQEQLFAGEAGAITAIVLMFICNVFNIIIISLQPQSKESLTFKVPLVPWMPALSTLINVYLMVNLSPPTWVRFGVWMAIGMPIYFFYGICHSTEENRGKENADKFGIDNPGGPGKPIGFIIPIINVELATPLNSAPNTPGVKHQEKKPVAPKSPLALEEALEKLPNSEEKDIEIQKTLESFDKIVDSLPGNLSQAEAPEELAESLSELHVTPTDSVEIPIENSLPLQQVPTSPPENKETKTEDGCSDSVDGGFKVMVNSVNETIEGETPHEAEASNVEETAENEDKENPTYQESDNNTDNSEQKTDNSEKPMALVMSQLLKNVPKADAINDGGANAENTSKHKPEPFDFSTENFKESRKFPMKSATSAPQMSASSPSSPTLNLEKSPGRHPTKILKRNSSFDGIPPSSADSPLARRVDKFFIIPVKEPDVSDSDSNSPQPSPSPSSSTNVQDALMTELKSKFKKLYDSKREEYEQESTKKGPMFYVGSDDSLVELANSADAQSPTTNHTRDYKRMNSRETIHLGEGLDTIRERGESKINIDDVKTDVINNTATDRDHDKRTQMKKESLHERINKKDSSNDKEIPSNETKHKETEKKNGPKQIKEIDKENARGGIRQNEEEKKQNEIKETANSKSRERDIQVTNKDEKENEYTAKGKLQNGSLSRDPLINSRNSYVDRMKSRFGEKDTSNVTSVSTNSQKENVTKLRAMFGS